MKLFSSTAAVCLTAALLAPPVAAQTPISGVVLGEQMAHCAGALHMVATESKRLRLSMEQRDALALTRYTMLATSVLLGDERGLAAVKQEREQLISKLRLTRPGNTAQVLNAEAAACIELVETHKEAVNARLEAAGRQP